jgi:hypothetical protein
VILKTIGNQYIMAYGVFLSSPQVSFWWRHGGDAAGKK